MSEITKDQFKQLYNEAPEGTDPEALIRSLQARGHTLEGLASPAPTPEKSAFQRLIDSSSEVIPEVAKSIGKRFTDTVALTADEFQKGTFSPGMSLLHTAGMSAGSVNDVIGGALKVGYKTAVPEKTQETIKSHAVDILNTPAGQAGLRAIKMGADAYGKFKSENPEIARSLEDVVNVAMLIPTGKVAGAVKNEAAGIKSDVGTLVSKLDPGTLSEDVQSAVTKGIEKSIRPSVAGKTSAAQVDQYFTKAKDAVSSIVANKDNLKFTDDAGEVVTGQLPKTLGELSDAIAQTKKSVFQEYNALTEATGKSGAKVEFGNVIPELEKAAQDTVLSVREPAVAQYAQSLADRFKKAGSFTPQQAEDFITQTNADLQSFYRNPTYGSGTKVQIDAMVANNLREGLDSIIENATGEGYQRLKKIYGSLKTIEKDVVHRAIVDARKNNAGLIDFTNIFSYGDIAAGLATGNLAQAGKGLIQAGIAKYFKFINDPNNIVKGMFEDVSNLLEKGKKAAEPFVPESGTFKLLNKAKNVRPGMSIEDVSKGSAGYSDNLLQEARKYKSAEEFVKAQGTPIYHGTNKDFNISEAKPGERGMFGQGVYFAHDKSNIVQKTGQIVKEATLSPDSKVFKTNFTKEINKYLDKQGYTGSRPPFLSGTGGEEFSSFMKSKGYDAIEMVNNGKKTTIVINPKKLVDKSQLTDLYHQATKQAESPLLQEARKYKSAEEFVKSKTPVFRSSKESFSAEKVNADYGIPVAKTKETAEIFNRGGRNIEDLYIEPGAKVLRELPPEFKVGDNFDTDIVAYAKKNGFDVIDLKPERNAGIEELRVVNPEMVKTKSQLTDLWKKAQGGVKESATDTIQGLNEAIQQITKNIELAVKRGASKATISKMNKMLDELHAKRGNLGK